jgi:glycosyltransferase involved in cell wall biosynthesis
MKIAYLDFNEDDFHEDYSISPKAYGGGRVFASFAKEINPDFHIYSNPESFKNLTDGERKQNCHPLNSEQRRCIREGYPIPLVIPEADQYDLFVHHQVKYHIIVGEKAKECCWAVGFGEYCDQRNTNLLLYNDYQHPMVGPLTKIHRIVIGKPIPSFRLYPKSEYIFQCTRHTEQFGSIEVAKLAKNYNIPVIFAGPIDKNYPLMDYVDGNLIKYIGIIPEEEKITYLKSAKFCTFLHKWNTPFNLSAIESLSYGTPVIATPVGFWPSLVDGTNGRLVSNKEEFFDCYKTNFSQRECWDTAFPYSQERMLESFFTVFRRIYEEN